MDHTDHKGDQFFVGFFVALRHAPDAQRFELSAHVGKAEEDRLVELDIRGELLEEELVQIVVINLINRHVKELIQRIRAALDASQRNLTDILVLDLLLDSLLHHGKRKLELAARL